MSERELLLGDEAVALGAIHEGISGAYSYPGTPATEIFEFVHSKAAEQGIYARWSANEKVAYEEALGMSWAGRRSIVSMKHVGLNVAADAFVNSAVTGVHGGLVLVVADDPGMHSSQNEQDTRYYAHFALVPCFEPSNQQQAYDMMRDAYAMSESLRLPVVMRLVTRLAHSRADIQTRAPRAQNALDPTTDLAAFTLLPTNARAQYADLVKKQAELVRRSEESRYNVLDLSPTDKRRGLIVTGIAMNYVREVLGAKLSVPSLHITQYPMPVDKIRALIDAVDEVIIVEEGYPFVEERVRGIVGIGKPLRGKLDGFLPRTGEVNPTVVAAAFGVGSGPRVLPTMATVPNRPPTLCPGCGHGPTFDTVREALTPFGRTTMFADIGCSTLGFYEPYAAIHSCVDMGASISMAAGAAHAGVFPVFCAIGDSTFAHSGMTPLLGATENNTNMNVMILDNGTVAMTGTQETMATGDDLVRIVAGLGVPAEHIHIIDPSEKKREENVRLLRQEIDYRGVSVFIFRRPCVHLKRRS